MDEMEEFLRFKRPGRVQFKSKNCHMITCYAILCRFYSIISVVDTKSSVIVSGVKRKCITGNRQIVKQLPSKSLPGNQVSSFEVQKVISFRLCRIIFDQATDGKLSSRI